MTQASKQPTTSLYCCIWVPELGKMAGTYNADVPTIKVDGNGREPRLKPDPDSIGASPAAQDDDIYEDAGDLEFSQDPSTIYLTRLPKFLWEKWSKLDDNDEIQIGTVRIEGATSDIKRVGRKFYSSCQASFR